MALVGGNMDIISDISLGVTNCVGQPKYCNNLDIVIVLL